MIECPPRSAISCLVIEEPSLDAADEEWLVWADAMQEIGDPRGELIALGHPDAYVRTYADALFGRTLGQHLRTDHLRITRWRRYLPDAIELRIDDAAWGPQLVIELASAEHMRAVRGLTIAGVPRSEPLSLAQTLGWFRESSLPPRLRSLALVDDSARRTTTLRSQTGQPGPNGVRFGPLAELWHACADLETLEMVVADPGQIQFHVIRLPELRSFALRPLCWAMGLGDMLANSRWPNLTSFEVRTCETYLQGDIANIVPMTWTRELAPLLRSLRTLPLERLAFTSWLSRDMLDLFRQELPAKLVELDLSDSAFDQRCAETFVADPIMRRLRRLVLEGVWLPSAAIFDGTVPEIVHSHLASAPRYRHVVD